MLSRYLAGLCLLILLPPVAAQNPQDLLTESMARHLVSRSSFGGTPEEVRALVGKNLELAARQMVDGPKAFDTSGNRFQLKKSIYPSPAKVRKLPRKERQKLNGKIQQEDRTQFERFRSWWVERMVTSEFGLQEKMTLFWHGYFTSSYRSVRNSVSLVRQNEVFRRHGLGNFRSLLRRVAKDPAMLRYLDNDRNRKNSPNENFARELMELFTLGEGNYSESDVKELARACTGWVNRRGRGTFEPNYHDAGLKTFLGRQGYFDLDDAIDVILAHEEAPVHLAGKLLSFFVGPDLPDGMAKRYADLLRENDWDLRPFFRTLFSDKTFYCPTVQGNRILGPVEYLVGIGRRLGENPPGWLLINFSDQLGQSLLYPPNVKGWEGGDSWITTSSMLQRGNFARYIIEGFDRLSPVKDFATMEDGRIDNKKRSGLNMMSRGVGQKSWRPETQIRELMIVAGATKPEEIVDLVCQRFLAVPITKEAKATLLDFMELEKSTPNPRIRRPRAFDISEDVLRRLVHLVLSLPEAQLG